MDLTAITFCKDNGLPILVFDLMDAREPAPCARRRADRYAGPMSDDDLAGMVLEDAREKMAKAVDHVRAEFGAVRTGRATPALVERLLVDYYGPQTPLRQLAGFSVPDAMLLVVTPYDKGSLGAIEKAIQSSDLGINPTNDGVVIRLAFPQLTEERRKELVKVVRHKAEEGRVAVRNVRRAAPPRSRGAGEGRSISSEDDVEYWEKELEKVTHQQVAAIDQVLGHKEHELLEV